VLGKGSTFSFDLQLKKSSKASGNTYIGSVSSFESLKGYKILLAEDNEVNVMVASKFMHKWDLEIDWACTGLEAVEMVKQNHYDLILMDLQMPKMDGYTASREIKTISKESKGIPIIALTASVLSEIKGKVMEAGMNDYISKPFNPTELYGKLAYYLRHGVES
jgi:CheY-like chemotaxis protein